MLTAKGVTAWRRALASLAPATPPARPAPPASARQAAQPALQHGLAAELISALAAIALAAAGPSP